jgi:hypothetical protein
VLVAANITLDRVAGVLDARLIGWPRPRKER